MKIEQTRGPVSCTFAYIKPGEVFLYAGCTQLMRLKPGYEHDAVDLNNGELLTISGSDQVQSFPRAKLSLDGT